MLTQERAWDGIRQRRILPPRGWLSGAIQRRRALHDPLFKIAFYILPPVIGRQLALHAEAYLPFIEEELPRGDVIACGSFGGAMMFYQSNRPVRRTQWNRIEAPHKHHE